MATDVPTRQCIETDRGIYGEAPKVIRRLIGESLPTLPRPPIMTAMVKRMRQFSGTEFGICFKQQTESRSGSLVCRATNLFRRLICRDRRRKKMNANYK